MAQSQGIKTGGTHRFAYPAEFKTLPDYTAHRGQPVTVIRQLTLEEADQDVGPMFKVRAADGWTGDAFADELEPIG